MDIQKEIKNSGKCIIYIACEDKIENKYLLTNIKFTKI